MRENRLSGRPNGIAALRRYVRPRPSVERCELCAVGLPGGHGHLVEIASRRILCACDACALLFAGEAETKHRRIPRHVRALSGFRMTDGQWDALLIPINLAFFVYSTAAGRVTALYPSPAGPTESLLRLDAWERIVDDNPIVGDMEPDVEALLVNRIRPSGCAPSDEYFIAPVDECFRLVGRIRAGWRGLSGGTEVWASIATFFDELRRRAIVVREQPDA